MNIEFIALLLLSSIAALGTALFGGSSSQLFLFLCFLTGFISIGSALLAYKRSHDPFHPLIFMGPMLFFLYCFMPLNLFYTDLNNLQVLLSDQQLAYVQTLNVVGVISFCAGVLSGDKKFRPFRLPKIYWNISSKLHKRINRAAILCGLLGVVGFVYGVLNIGGLASAYGRSYGGGSAQSGYIREAILLTLPALLWLMTTHVNRRLSKIDWLWIALFIVPLLAHGLLGARRGPTFVSIIALCVGWYLVQFRRPALSTVLTSGFLLGMLLLFLVANRGEIYLGSDFEFQRSPTEFINAHSGNEYIYGAGSILNADYTGQYFWGKRYFTVFFIRPIPRFLWPSKYKDASELLGIPNLEHNMGTGGSSFAESLGWAGAVGAAPGIVADMWIEFRYLAFLALFCIGNLYGTAWRKAVSKGSLWIPTYTLMSAFSIYLIMQTLEAMAFRFIFTGIAVWFIWRYSTEGLSQTSEAQLQPFISKDSLP